MGWRQTSVVTNIVVTYGSGLTGLFQYSGTPRHGNPPVAWSVPPSVADDPYGNVLAASGGFTSGGTSGYSQLAAGAVFLSNNLNADPGTLLAPAGLGGQLQIVGPRVTAGDTPAGLTLTSVSGGGLGQPFTQVQGALLLLDMSAPSAAASGGLLYVDSSGQEHYLRPSGLDTIVSGAQLADVAGHTVTAATLTAITNAWTVPANDPVTGAVYELTAFGHGTQGTTAETLEFAALHGGTTIFTFTFPALFAAAAAAFAWKLTLRVVIGSTGVTGTYFAELDGLAGSGGTSNPVPGLGGTLGAHTIDTTTAGTFSLQAAWGSAAVGATVTCDADYFKRVA